MRILISYFSYTSRVEKLAERIAAELKAEHQVTTVRIRPTRERSYPNWLLRSFVPGSSVPIQAVRADLRDFQAVCLGFPKWTFSCPPLNRYLSLITLSDSVRLGLFMSFGGFDEDRYLKALRRRLAERGRVAATLAVKRDLVESPDCAEAISSFCAALLSEPTRPRLIKLG